MYAKSSVTKQAGVGVGEILFFRTSIPSYKLSDLRGPLVRDGILPCAIFAGYWVFCHREVLQL
jgi:hypothetical protein